MGLLEVGNINRLGRVLFGITLCYMGYQMMVDGPEFYNQFLQAWRRIILPESKNKINESLTYEMLCTYAT